MSNANQPVPFRRHVNAIMKLALPLAGAHLAQMAISVTDTIMIGWLGAQPLAASVLGTQFFFVMFIFGSGFAMAIVPLAASALGQGDNTQLRRSVRMGFWVVGMYSIPALLLMGNSDAIYTALQQEPNNIKLANDYLRIAMWGVLPAMAIFVLRSFLTTLELARIVLWATIGGAVLNAILNYALIFGNFGAPRLELEGAAWASLGTQMLSLIVLVIYSVTNSQAREYAIFHRLWKPDWPAFREILSLGFPISLNILAEVGLFIGASVLMGWISTFALAAHGIALQIASVTFMIHLGIANATSVRLGNAYGRKDWISIGGEGNASLITGLIIAFFAAVVFFVFPGELVSLFLDQSNRDTPHVLAYAIPLIFVAAIFQIADAVQAILLGMLRGLKDTNVPMRIGVISYWIIGMPVAYILAFPLELGGVGVWTGLAFGLTTAALLLYWRYYTRETNGVL